MLTRKHIIVLLFCFLVSCMPSAKLKHYSEYRIRSGNSSPIPAGKVRVTFFGTSSLLFDDGETQILVDGFVSRPGMLKTAYGKIGSDTALIHRVMDRTQMTGLKAIFTAHSHYDHAMDAPYFAKYSGAELHGSASTLNIGRGAGLPEAQLHMYDPGTELQFGRFTVVILNSRHSNPFQLMGKSNDDLGETIDEPLSQPAKVERYKEGGAYDILIRHGDHSALIKASTHFVEGALDHIHADVLFLGIARLGKENVAFRESFYDQTVGVLKPALLVPVHWDNFFKPLKKKLKPIPKIADDVDAGLKYLIQRTATDSIDLLIMQRYESMLLF